MKLNFTQGLVRFQKELNGNTPKFIQVNSDNSGYIDLVCSPDPTVIVFAHKHKNYIIEEHVSVERAWGPLPPTGQTQHLFWDINFTTGELSRGFTLLTPAISSHAPPNPNNDQHWFDTNQKTMFVWNGSKWIERIRVFAGIYDSSAILAPRGQGTQAGLNNLNIDAGNILTGAGGNPLRDIDGSFLTTESELQVSRVSSENIRFDSLVKYCQATESVPKFHLVSYVGLKEVALASYLRADRQVAGAVREHLYPGETGRVITSGPLRNDAWNFAPSDIGKPLFCGPSGQITLAVPPTGIVQQIGMVTDPDEINLWIHTPIVL